ncbi:uroporphyrinogen-III synthase [Halosquirtibacter laminarini]|uniref:Uroporphyrinogen-III synthase n=1 Tax=Halosquirtibacter laminarini TaxID=3374600 RepID=A0AC61NEB9_9BACT|nr:uroporphyrinogen-III synthase [Prolixibacteraceae bacterium]
MKSILLTKSIDNIHKGLIEQKHPNIKIDIVPFIKTIGVPFSEPLWYPYVVFTSQNAFKYLLSNEDCLGILKSRGCIAVGDKTLQLLKKSHVNVIAPSKQNSEGIIELINQHTDIRGITYFCGKRRHPLLESYLKSKHIRYEAIEVYDTIDCEVEIDVINYDIVLFASPSAVDSFFSQYDNIDCDCYAIGPTTAAALYKFTDRVKVANEPSIESMIDLIIENY